MKRHQTASAVSLGARDDHVAVVANGTRTAFTDNQNNTRFASSGQPVALPSVDARTHTLVLTGELDRRSAHALEAEIERLCEDGVSGITLDLRELTYIDSIGVAVIVFRCGLCKRRGFDFSLVRGPASVQRVFEQSGVGDLLPFAEQEISAARLPALVAVHRSRDACE
ncbi:MAG TPA: STAS domain-containing protein [Gemmatimonadales bacterium]|jgi:anti-sigma B factor antagonist|nr:STAS domain-containing protein [Gemmatimonadales bacterium]